MSEQLFRLIEIIGILLPLTGIFVQLSIRVVDDLLDVEPETMETLQSTLLAAALTLGIAGSVAAALLAVRLDDGMAQLVALVLYVSFMLITAAVATMWTWVHPGFPLPLSQQRLQDTEDNDTGEE